MLPKLLLLISDLELSLNGLNPEFSLILILFCTSILAFSPLVGIGVKNGLFLLENNFISGFFSSILLLFFESNRLMLSFFFIFISLVIFSDLNKLLLLLSIPNNPWFLLIFSFFFVLKILNEFSLPVLFSFFAKGLKLNSEPLLSPGASLLIVLLKPNKGGLA